MNRKLRHISTVGKLYLSPSGHHRSPLVPHLQRRPQQAPVAGVPGDLNQPPQGRRVDGQQLIFVPAPCARPGQVDGVAAGTWSKFDRNCEFVAWP